MRNAIRCAWLAFISIFVFFLSLSCSSNSSTTYSIEGSVTPTEAGSVTPATGEYDEGADVEIQAEANDTWMFSGWEGDVSGTENPIIVTVDDDIVFTAIFEKLQYPLDITVDGGGSVEENIIESKMKDYEIGTEVELNAVADEGWVFVEWQGDLTGSENPQTLTMDDSKSVTAVFERKNYPLTISTEGEGNVSEEVVEEPAKDYAYETVVELTANPSEGWEFARWEGDLESSDNPAQITIDSEKEVTAVFEREGYELTVTVNGEGSVNEELIDDPSKTSYPFDSVVELTAEPADGWTFVEWQGDLSGDENPEEITMDQNKEVTAVFERRDYALNINKDGEGSVDEEVVEEPAKDYAYETVVELTANPADGWEFARWEGDLEGSDNPQQITVDEEKTVTAVFERETYELTVDTNGQGNVNEEKVDQAKTSYGYNSIVELTAEPDEGWVFDEWEGDLSGSDNPEQITIDEDKNVTAVFVEAQYELDLSTQGDGSGDINVDPNKDFYNHGDEIELTANPDETSEFDEWDGDISGSENPKNVTVTSDLEIIAIFGGAPEVETADWSDMRVTSVTAGGEVTDNGGFEVTDRGVCWSFVPEFTDEECTVDGSGTGSFNSTISDLTQGSLYYVRAYATNQAGTGYGKTIELRAGYISHGFINGLTPSNDSKFENRSYKLVKSEWKGGVDKIWIEKNLGASTAVKSATDDNPNGAGWYFQFNREQGYYHDGSNLVPNGDWESGQNKKTDWQIENDPCRIAFGGNWRIPNQQEWADFRNAPASDDGMSSGDLSDAFDSLLRIHGAGVISVTGNLNNRGNTGLLWASDTADSNDGTFIWITGSGSTMDAGPKGDGTPLRCVKD